MKRTTVMIPEDLANLLELERRRSNRSTARIVREALASYLRAEGMEPKRLPFASLGRSGQRHTAREAEDILAREWGDASSR